MNGGRNQRKGIRKVHDGGALFAKNSPQIGTRLAGSGEALSDAAIEVAIHRLRRRLEPYDLHVRTVRGFGYLLETAEAAPES